MYPKKLQKQVIKNRKKTKYFKMKLTKKVAIFVESRKESGGAYQEILNFIKNIKKYNQDNLEFLIICTSKKLNFKLEDENLELHYFSMNALERYICYLRNFGPFVKRIKKYFFIRNKFENFLKKINVDLIFFTAFIFCIY